MRKHRLINRPFFARDENYQFSIKVGSVITIGSYLEGLISSTWSLLVFTTLSFLYLL